MTNPIIAVHQVFQHNTSEDAGSPLYEFFELLTTAFVVPAIGSDVGIAVADSTRYAVGQYIWIPGAGFFEITALNGVTGIYVRNNGSAGTEAAGTTVPSGTFFMPSTEVSAALDPDDFFFLYDTLAQAFTIPADGADAYAYVSHGDWYAIGMQIFIAGAGWFRITDTDSTLDRLTVQWSGEWNATAGGIIAAGAILYPSPAPLLQADGSQLIQSGSVACATTNANDTEGCAVTFPIAFAAAPTSVVISIQSDVNLGGLVGACNLYVRNITTTGFKVFYSATAIFNFNVKWIAMA